MYNKHRKLLSLIAAAGMTAALIPGAVFAENEKIQGTKMPIATVYSVMMNTPAEYEEQFSSVTFDEVMTELCGNYVFLQSKKDVSAHTDTLNCIGEDGKMHIITSYCPEMLVKVKEGTDLPIDEIRSEAKESGIKMPNISLDGDTYRINAFESKNALNFLLTKLADCENVLSVTDHYAIYENRNYLSLTGLCIGKEELSDEARAELLEKLMALGAAEDKSKTEVEAASKKGYRYCYSFDTGRSGDSTEIYAFYKYLDETGISYSTASMQTCLAEAEPVVYFCSKEYPLGQKYDYVKQTVIPAQNPEQKGVDLFEVMQEVRLPSEKLDAKYKSMSIEEAFSEICGNYVGLSSSSDDNALYSSGHGSSLYKIDDKGKIHILNIYGADTVIKVKEGTELALSQITDGISDKNMRISVQDNIYRITNVSLKENMDILLNNIGKCDNVLSIDEHFVVYEDTANHVSSAVLIIDSQLPEGADKEELFEKMAEFGLQADADGSAAEYPAIYDSEWRFGFGEAVRKNSENLYSALKYLSDKDMTYFVPGAATEMGMTTAEVYYCNRPVLVNGMTGDANTDGELDMSDAVMIMQSLANPDKYGVKAASGITVQGIRNGDSNGDGLTTNDALAIQKKLLGLE